MEGIAKIRKSGFKEESKEKKEENKEKPSHFKLFAC
jgi:hypothetical protein